MAIWLQLCTQLCWVQQRSAADSTQRDREKGNTYRKDGREASEGRDAAQKTTGGDGQSEGAMRKERAAARGLIVD